MTRSARVVLHWLVNVPPSGRSPRGPHFSTPARFDHQGDDWLNDAWSLVVATEGYADKKGEQTAIVQFLVADAPHDWLTVGKRFTLFEGKLLLAEGQIKEIMPN